MSNAPTLLPGFEPSAADLMQIAMSRPLAEKVQNAIGLLQLYEPMALGASTHGYYLAYSGGKDSGCILELARMAGVAYRPVYNVTTIDPPELVRFIKREHPEVRFHHPKQALLSRLVERSPPTRLARWCCEEYKEQGGCGEVIIIGVRAAESPRRAAIWKMVTPHKKRGTMVCPILYWTDEDVWEFHRIRGLSYCELYDQGFRRLGCVGCPLAGPKAQRVAFDRWPRYEMLWRRAFERFWDRWHGVPTRTGQRRYFEDFGSAQGLWDWWISGNAAVASDEGCQMEFMFSNHGDIDYE